MLSDGTNRVTVMYVESLVEWLLGADSALASTRASPPTTRPCGRPYFVGNVTPADSLVQVRGGGGGGGGMTNHLLVGGEGAWVWAWVWAWL